jgi:hypothetical protein
VELAQFGSEVVERVFEHAGGEAVEAGEAERRVHIRIGDCMDDGGEEVVEGVRIRLHEHRGARRGGQRYQVGGGGVGVWTPAEVMHRERDEGRELHALDEGHE